MEPRLFSLATVSSNYRFLFLKCVLRVLTTTGGRPDGKANDKLRMAPMAKRLSELLGKPVSTTQDCIGAQVDASTAAMHNGDVLLLENVSLVGNGVWCRFAYLPRSHRIALYPL